LETLNINIPELKTFNILPIIVSPYPLSVTINNNGESVFTFEDKNVGAATGNDCQDEKGIK
jgi:hypothetical protein